MFPVCGFVQHLNRDNLIQCSQDRRARNVGEGQTPRAKPWFRNTPFLVLVLDVLELFKVWPTQETINMSVVRVFNFIAKCVPTGLISEI